MKESHAKVYKDIEEIQEEINESKVKCNQSTVSQQYSDTTPKQINRTTNS